jgi:DNA (cytosine-5)-methyltransferase 1
MKRPLDFVDTFAGIGGFRLGMQAACAKLGIACRCVASIEINPEARRTYGDNFGEEPSEDVTKIRPEDYPDHDVLLGGPPCQPFSRNGKFYNHNNMTLGEDDRQNMFLYLMAVLSAKKPKFFLFENVKEITTIRNRDGSGFFETLLSNLRGCGYHVVPMLLNSADFGVPQQRNRTFLAGFRDDLSHLAVIFGPPQDNSDPGPVADVLLDVVDGKYLLSNLWKNRMLNGGQDGREEDGIRGVLDRLGEKGIKKPKFAAALERRLETHGKRLSRLEALRIAHDCGQWESPKEPVKKIVPVAIIYGDTPSGLPRQQDKLYSKFGISPTIATFSIPPFDADGGWRILAPRECARLQGFPDSFRLHRNDQVAYKQVGNAVTVDVVAAILTKMLEKAG